MNSPLGQYAQVTAVIVVLSTIAAWLVTIAIGNVQAANLLGPYATLAFGAVLGSAATVNGIKRDTVALHQRLDRAGIPPTDAA